MKRTDHDDTSERSTRLPSVASFVEQLYRFLAQHAFSLILAVVIASFLAMLGLRIHLVTAYIPELGGIESNVIYSVQRILDGYPLYTDPAHPPYSITQYTPLYYYLCWCISKVLHVDVANVHQVYILSRSVSLVLNLLFAGTAFVILRDIFRVGKGLSFIAFSYVFVYLDEESFSRPDSLYNLLVLVTIGLFLKSLIERESVPSRGYLIAASLSSVVTIFAKQSGIYLPVILLFFTVFYLKNFRWTLISFSTMILSFSGLFFLSSGGHVDAFLQNTVQGVNNGASLGWFAERIMIEHFQKERFINIVGLFLGFYYLATGPAKAHTFLGLAILGSFAFALVTSVKIGAAPNYFTEFIALTVMAASVFVTSHGIGIESDPARKKLSAHYQPLFLLVFVLFTLPPRFAGKFAKKVVEINHEGEQEYLSNQAIARYLYETEQLQPDDQVFVTTHVEDYLNKFLYRNVIFPHKEIVVANPPGAYDYSAFKQGLENGEVDYVIADLRKGHVDTVGQTVRIDYRFVGADFSPYVPIKQMGHYLIFKHQCLTRRQYQHWN